jgi:hypothetical protein
MSGYHHRDGENSMGRTHFWGEKEVEYSIYINTYLEET